MIDLAVAKSFRGGRGGRSLIRGNNSELFLSRVGSWCSGRRLENATRSSARDRALPPRYNTLTRLPHQLLLTRAAFRSSDSPRTARSRNAGEIPFLSPTSSPPQVSTNSTHPLAGHRPLLQVTDSMFLMSFSTLSIFQATQSWSLPGHAVPGPAEQSTTHLSSCPANPTRHSLPALCPLRPVQARTRLLAPGRPVSRSVQPGPLSQR